jgi:monoamine oxidase
VLKVTAYKDWARDPLQKGCGFSLAPGQVNAFGRDFIKPWQVMHFAGEHTRRSDFGMESAMESSERAVLEVANRG